MAKPKGFPAYQMAKMALNAVTRMAADAAGGRKVAVNSVCPGWTRTELDGPHAPQSPAEAADTIVWLAMQPRSTPTGGFFAERQALNW